MTPETVSPPICDLRGYVQVFDDSLPVSFCQQLVASFHQTRDRHVTRRKGWRAGLDESSWTELDITPLADDAFKGFFYRKIDDYLSLYNRQFGLTIPVPTSTLLAHGLADEVLLIVHPVLVGTGKRFFADGTPRYAFELVSTKTTPARPCGDLDTARHRRLPSISDRYAASISAAINRRFCTAAPAAPLPRLSRTAPKTI